MPRRTAEFDLQSDMYFASGSAYPQLAEATAASMGVKLGAIGLKGFPNGERYVRLDESVRQRHAVLMQSFPHTSELDINAAFVELLLMAQAARLSSADEITLIMPKMPYDRQDRQVGGREAVGAAAIMQALKDAGADRLVTVDMHSSQTAAGFNDPVDVLPAKYLIFEALKEQVAGRCDDFVVVSPDAGRAGASEWYAEGLGVDLVHMPKRRDPRNPGRISRPDYVNDVDGRVCLITDDMIDTAGTLQSAAVILDKSGASGVFAAATHGIFSDPAFKRLDDSPIQKLIVTNTLPTERAEAALGNRLQVLDIAPTLGEAVTRIVSGGSLSELFGGSVY